MSQQWGVKTINAGEASQLMNDINSTIMEIEIEKLIEGLCDFLKSELSACGSISERSIVSACARFTKIRHQKEKNLQILINEPQTEQHNLHELESILIAQHPNPTSLRDEIITKSRTTSIISAPASLSGEYRVSVGPEY